MADAFNKVGNDGVITVEEGKSLDTYVDVVEGMQFDRGYLSPYFVTDPDDMRSSSSKPLHPRSTRSKVDQRRPEARAGAREGHGLRRSRLLIIAEDVDRRGARARSSSTSSAASSRSRRSRRRATAIAARRCCRTSRSSPAGEAILSDLGIELGLRSSSASSARRRSIEITADNSTTVIEGAGSTKADIEGPHRPDPLEIENSTAIPTTTARSSRSGSPSWPAASPRSTSGQRHRGRAEGKEGPRRGRPARDPLRPSPRASSPAAA